MKIFPSLRSTLLFVAVPFVCALSARAGLANKTLDIYWVDSEGGGSTLIVTPEGESVLIDSGNPGGRDPGRIFAAAKAAGLTRIDHFLLTHFHIDHFGGVPELSALIPIGTVYDKGIPESDPDGRTTSTFPLTIKPYREFKADHRVTIKAGSVIPLRVAAGGTPLSLRCLGVNKVFVEPAANQPRNPLVTDVPQQSVDTSDNANSAVFILQFGDFRFFDGGDLTWNIEETLVSPYNLVGTVDVYQSQHHGLDRSNHPTLVRSLEPTVVVMNNGAKKGGQPGTFVTLKSTKSIQAIFQLHRNIATGPAGNTDPDLIANTDEDCSGKLISLSATPDSREYAISIPATGQMRRFKTKPPANR